MSLPTRRRHPRTAVVVAAIVTLAVSAAGCSRVVDGSAVIATPGIGDPISWHDCGFRDDVEVPAGTQCGMFAVPVDWNEPDDGNVAQLAMVKIPATGDKIGSLLINPGGPGESGVELAVSLAGSLPADVRERFDFVGFDPRGVGSSRPAVWCNSDEDNDKSRADPVIEYTPEGVAYIEQKNQEYVQRCVDKMGEEFLANVGTVSVAKDLDAMRAALGDEKLTYLGYSYGTSIGATYAELFPQNVRAMILDGAVDPNAEGVEARVRQAASFQEAFDDYAAECALSPNCPLGTDPAKAVDVYRDLTYPLVENPAETEDPRGLSYRDAVTGTILTMYSPNLWRHLTTGLTELTQGRGDTLLALADLYMGRDQEGHYTNSTDARAAVNCVDKPALDNAAEVEIDRQAEEVAPFMYYGTFTGIAPRGTCSMWPVPPTSEPHEIEVENLTPTLVVSTTVDPATPYEAGVSLAEQLGAALLTFEGTQHTVMFQGNQCVDEIGARYLIDGTLPQDGARC